MKVSEFWDMVMLNENHNIKIKSNETDETLIFFNSVEGMEKSGFADRKIKHIACDWENRRYILWV